MKRHTIWLAAILLFCLAAGAQAQTDALEALKKQVQQLQDQLKAAMDQIKAIEAKQAAAAPAPKEKWSDKLSVTGYFHARYEAREDTIDDFFIRRLYVNLIGNWNDRAQSVITFGRVGPEDPKIDLEVAMVNYKFRDNWVLTFGQAPNFFGWDTAESSSKRLPFDRWAAGEGIPGRPGRPGIRGLYFAGPWDRGVYVTRQSQASSEPTVILGLVNGNFRNSDNDNNKVWSVDLKWKPRWGQFGASYMDGKYTEVPPGAAAGTAAVTQPRRALGLFVHTEPTPFGFQGEFLDGEMFGKDVQGWYGQVAYNKGGPGTPYFRYEQFDQDQATMGNTFVGWRLGYAYQVDKNNEVTLEIHDAHAGSIDYGQLGAQWQVAF